MNKLTSEAKTLILCAIAVIAAIFALWMIAIAVSDSGADDFSPPAMENPVQANTGPPQQPVAILTLTNSEWLRFGNSAVVRVTDEEWMRLTNYYPASIQTNDLTFYIMVDQ